MALRQEVTTTTTAAFKCNRSFRPGAFSGAYREQGLWDLSWPVRVAFPRFATATRLPQPIATPASLPSLTVSPLHEPKRLRWVSGVGPCHTCEPASVGGVVRFGRLSVRTS